MKKSWKGVALVAPTMLGCMVFYIVPFLMVIYYSFRSSAGKNGSFIGLKNYEQILKNQMFRLAAWNTVRFLAIALPLILLLSYGIALWMTGKKEKYTGIRSVFLLPYTMPVVGNILLVETLFSQNGALNQMLGWAGISGKNWLESSLAFGVVVVLYLWKSTGYSVVLLVAGLVTIPEEQYDAAEIDGADSLEKFFYITTPQMWYSVFFALLFSIIHAFQCFREIFLVGGKHPNSDIYMLQHFINNSFEGLNYTRLSAASVLLFLVVTTVIGTFYRWVNAKEDYKP